ncbi:hypothetical protein [Nesterenkonia pannonica]|uniref:hypothetical protein n=1 Tax=Nesterenkonia pannonica TaxID=1548602 RepID=UPI0021643169|nr:hypothetical protein [Nesterenkonia pannonica]
MEDIDTAGAGAFETEYGAASQVVETFEQPVLILLTRVSDREHVDPAPILELSDPVSPVRPVQVGGDQVNFDALGGQGCGQGIDIHVETPASPILPAPAETYED